MPIPRTAPAPRTRRRRPRPATALLAFRVGLVAAIATLVLAAGIAWQMASGRDPVLGASADGGATGSLGSTRETVAATNTAIGAYSEEEEWDEEEDDEDSEDSDDEDSHDEDDGAAVALADPAGTTQASSGPAPVTTRSS